MAESQSFVNPKNMRKFRLPKKLPTYHRIATHASEWCFYPYTSRGFFESLSTRRLWGRFACSLPTKRTCCSALLWVSDYPNARVISNYRCKASNILTIRTLLNVLCFPFWQRALICAIFATAGPCTFEVEFKALRKSSSSWHLTNSLINSSCNGVRL